MVPHADAHEAPFKSAYYNALSVKIVGVTAAVPGGFPTITFSVTDLNGPLTPSLTAPIPASDAGRGGKLSPVPRALSSVSFTFIGPTTEYSVNSPSVSDSTSGTVRPAVPDPAVPGQYSYTFTKPLSASASGSWAVIVSARRSVATKVYDATGKFTWPYTGETIAETTDNDVQYVIRRPASGPAGTPSRGGWWWTPRSATCATCGSRCTRAATRCSTA